MIESERMFLDILFHDCGEVLRESEATNILTNINLELPRDYFDFLCKVNGGVPSRSSFNLYPENSASDGEKNLPEEQFEVREFYGLTHCGAANICIAKICQIAKIINCPDARSLLLIGDCGINNIYMSLSDDYFGFIYFGSYTYGESLFCPDESALDDELDDIFTLYQDDTIANSFSELLSKLA